MHGIFEISPHHDFCTYCTVLVNLLQIHFRFSPWEQTPFPDFVTAKCREDFCSYYLRFKLVKLVQCILILLFYFIRALNLCRIFTELGESYLPVIVATPGKVHLHINVAVVLHVVVFTCLPSIPILFLLPPPPPSPSPSILPSQQYFHSPVPEHSLPSPPFFNQPATQQPCSVTGSQSAFHWLILMAE